MNKCAWNKEMCKKWTNVLKINKSVENELIHKNEQICREWTKA